MIEVLPPEDGLVPATQPEPKPWLRHLPLVVSYAGLTLAVGAGILIVAVLAFVAEMLIVAAILGIVALLLLIVVPAAFLDTRAKNKARRDQISHPDK